VRLGALVAVTLLLMWIGHVTGLTEQLTRERIQATMSELGALGFLAFVAAFAIGELVHVPGVVFVVAAMFAYGPGMGSVAGLVGATVSVTVTFFVVRLVGGQPLGDVERPFLRRMLAQLDRRPVTTIIVLRLLFQMLPALNYGLAMSKVRYRDYVVGSALGLVPVVLVMALAFEPIVAFFGL
jgi:uncharacterized membrane protein YdjX (TVP38/TMEM64 family)